MLLKPDIFRVENYLPSQASLLHIRSHWTWTFHLPTKPCMAWLRLSHHLSEFSHFTSSLFLPPLLPFFFLPLLSLSPTSGPLHCLLPCLWPRSYKIPSQNPCLNASIFSFCFIILHHICLSLSSRAPEGAEGFLLYPQHTAYVTGTLSGSINLFAEWMDNPVWGSHLHQRPDPHPPDQHVICQTPDAHVFCKD